MRPRSPTVTNGNHPKELPLWKLLLICAAIILFVFVAKIEQRSSRVIEWLLNPDHIIALSVDWRDDHPSASPVTVVDVDNASFEAWGQPLSMPREKLFDLVDALDRRGAAAIVVDVDLTTGPTAADVDLATKRIADYVIRTTKEPNRAATPLILVRGLWEVPRDRNSQRPPEIRIPSHLVSNGSSALNEAIQRFDALVSGTSDMNPNSTVLWASALFDADATGTIRNWRLFETVCDANKSNRRTFLSVGVITAALSKDGRQRIQELRSGADAYAQRYCDSIGSTPEKIHTYALGEGSAGESDLAPENFAWLRYKMPSARLPYFFWPAPTEAFRFGTARDSSGRVVPLIDIRSAANVLHREMIVRQAYGDPEFCRRVAEVNPAPLSCEAIRGRVVVIGASHVDSRDNYFTPLGPMAGVYVIANTIAGARDTLLSEPSLKNSANLWGIVLFVIFAIVASRVQNLIAIVLGIMVAATFLTAVSGWLAIPTSTTYQSINIAIVMLALFLAVRAVANDAEKWLTNCLRWLMGKKEGRQKASHE